MEPIKLIALDMDGTLLDDNKELSEKNKEAIEKALDAGILVIPATGRTTNGLHRFFLENPRIHLAVCSNGALVYNMDTGEVLHTASLSKQKIKELENLFVGKEVLFDVFRNGEVFTDAHSPGKLAEYNIDPMIIEYLMASRTPVPDLKEWIDELPEDDYNEKITVFFKDNDSKMAGWEMLSKQDGINISSSLGPNIEVNASGATKGQALAWLAEHLDIPLSQVMACGDNGNDLDMIETVGLGVAMGNAIDEVKEIADVVTETNNDHGVAKAIEKHAL